jgi:uncharacterized protein YnzC (UPF0291/DUF896 family)
LSNGGVSFGNEFVISSANQYARDIERINTDSSINSEDTEGLTRKERKDREKTRIDKVQQIKCLFWK